ncbi:MAG: hypothetical protein ACI9R3_006045 [Verrucomicrobiales bacterium]|jgi:hypothetical protein
MNNPYKFYLSILAGALICFCGRGTASGQNAGNALGTALEAGELNWVASPVGAWRAVSSSSAKVNRDMVAYFESEAFVPDNGVENSAGEIRFIAMLVRRAAHM